MAGPFSCVLRGWAGVWCRQEFVRSRSFRRLAKQTKRTCFDVRQLSDFFKPC